MESLLGIVTVVVLLFVMSVVAVLYGEVILAESSNFGTHTLTTVTETSTSNSNPGSGLTSTVTSTITTTSTNIVTMTTTTTSTYISGQTGVAATYSLESAPTSQWLIIHSVLPITFVFTSNLGNIAEYSTLAALNQTSIGSYCIRVGSSGTCEQFVNMTEPGWYYDMTNALLYIHYLGGNVTIEIGE